MRLDGLRRALSRAVLIDDASNRTYARLYPAETTEAAFDVFRRWVNLYGLPRSLYVDRHSIYRDEGHPQKPTQFGRAMKQLGVELIQAHSPQAKGRVERRHAVFQDRLVKEMRLRGIGDMRQANALLDEMFLADLNRRYAVEPADGQDLHRAVEAVDPGLVLEEVLCVQEERAVGRDWCLRWRNRWLQVDQRHAALSLAGRKVLVKHRGDGRLIVEHKGQPLTFAELTGRPAAAAKKKNKKAIVNNRRWKPPENHPWKSRPGGEAAAAGPRVSLAPAAPTRDSHAGKKSKAG